MRIIITRPGYDKVIKMKDYELTLVANDRDLIFTPQQSGSNLVFDSFFMKNFDQQSYSFNTKLKKKYQFKLNANTSRQKQTLSFDFSYPADHIHYYRSLLNYDPWVVLIATNISLYNKPEGFFNLQHYDSIQIPMNINLEREDLKAEVELALMVSNPVNWFSQRMVYYQFTSVKEVPVNSDDITHIIFPFNEFQLDTTYQPTIPLSRISGLENVRLSDHQYRGFLFQFQFKLLFQGMDQAGEEPDYSPIMGSIAINDPVIFQQKDGFFDLILHPGNLVFGFLGSILFLFCWMIYQMIKKTRRLLLKLNISRSYLEGKKEEVSRLQSVIVDNLSAGKGLIEEQEGYYFWRLSNQKETNFLGLQREGVIADKFINSFYFEKLKDNIQKKTIILVIDYDQLQSEGLNYLLYYYKNEKVVKYPEIKVTRKSYWFYLLAFLIYTPRGYFKMARLDYENVLFNKFGRSEKGIPCLRVPQNNHDLGIDNEKYLEMINRYQVKTIIDVNRKQKERNITYSLNREVDYLLFVHSRLMNHSPFIITDASIMSY
ncbi:MAG: hypothetical protein MJB14_20985 [Spirochaetes bacterium]|nr:hypothetical protein [Spirochaetota bacterium]